MKWIYFLIINVIAFSLMGLDKRKAKEETVENARKYVVFIGGSWRTVGAWIGMYMFHHKTHKRNLFSAYRYLL